MITSNTDISLTFFLLLVLGHFVGDFVLQPYWLVIAKRNGWKGLIIHVGVVTFVTTILVWGVIPNWWVWMIVLFLIHLFIDQFRTFVFIDNSRGKGLLLLLLDQTAHISSLVFIAWAATGWQFSSLSELFNPETHNLYRAVIYLTGLAFLISTVPVLEAEITVAVWAAQGREVTQTVRIDTEDRVLGSLERIVALTLILFNLIWLVPLVFVPRLAIMIYQGHAKEDRTAVATKVITSFASAIFISLVLYGITPPVIPV